MSSNRYRFEFYDTSSPENWRLLDPDVIIICFDISQRLSLINMKRYVSTARFLFIYLFVLFISYLSTQEIIIIYKSCNWHQWINEVKQAFSRRDSLPVVIMGLKRDLRSEDDPNGIIYPQDAYRMAQEMRADRYVECSAVTGELIRPAFEDICKTAIATTTEIGGQSEGGCTIM